MNVKIHDIGFIKSLQGSQELQPNKEVSLWSYLLPFFP